MADFVTGIFRGGIRDKIEKYTGKGSGGNNGLNLQSILARMRSAKGNINPNIADQSWDFLAYIYFWLNYSIWEARTAKIIYKFDKRVEVVLSWRKISRL